MSTAKKRVIRHAFIDESERSNKGFMLCAVTVVEGDVAVLRTQLAALRPKTTGRIHMKSVANGDRMKIITAIAGLEAHSKLYVVTKKCSAREARDIALSSAFADLSGMDVVRTVIESCNQDVEDRRIIHNILGPDPDLQYHHEPASMNNPMLWLPDVHAWAWGRGGKYKRAIEHRITEIQAP